MGLSVQQVLLCVGMLVTGSLNTLSKKAQNDCSAPGWYDLKANKTAVVHKFDHPWFQTFIMFIGEMTCLFGLAYSRYKKRQILFENERNRLMVSPGNSGELAARVLSNSFPRVFQWIFAVPTVFDLIGTSLAGIGLLYVEASVWQMLRGSIIVFTGFLSQIFLRRKLKKLQWLGIYVTVAGLVLVGLSGVLREEHHTNSKVVLGILFILVGQVVSSGQMIIEEMFLKKKNYEPLQVVGMEGTFGVLFMGLVVLPVMYFVPGSQIGDCYENSIDALYQIKNDFKLALFSIMYLLSIAFYNYFGLAVTKSLTAVHRTLLDACRTIVVWLVGLFIYYIASEEFGEPFDKKYGIFQIDGFLLLLMGTALYNEIMDVPCVPSLRRSQTETYPSLVDSNVTLGESSVQREITLEDEKSPLLQQQHSNLPN